MSRACRVRCADRFESLSLANCYSSRCWKVIESLAVLLPAESIQRGLGVKSTSGGFLRHIAVEYSRRTVSISRSTKGCDRGVYGTLLISFTSRMRRFAFPRWYWNRQWVIVRTQVLGCAQPGCRFVEHTTKGVVKCKTHQAPIFT